MQLKAFVIKFKRLLIRVVSEIVLYWPLFVQKKRINVLIVRIDAIGDFILWLDGAKYYKQLYPKKKIILVTSKPNVELAKELAYWDEVWEFDRDQFYSNFIYHVKFILKVCQNNFEIAIQPTYSREDCGDYIVKASGAIHRIGSSGDCANMAIAQKSKNDEIYTKLVLASKAPLMEFERNAEFLRGLGLASVKSSIASIKPKSDWKPYNFVDFLFYILFPSASWQEKKWPITSFAEIADRIYHKTGLTGILCGQSFETENYNKLIKISNAPLLNYAGKTSLTELIYMIEKSCFLISNDTSSIHIAASVSTASVCILGGGHFGRFVPYQVENLSDHTKLPVPVYEKMECYNCNWLCPYIRPNENLSVPCIKNISVDKAWNEIEQMIDSLVIRQKYPIN